MKKFALFIVALFATTTVHAAPVGNTAAPKTIEQGFFTCYDTGLDLRLGYEGDFVSDGRMQQYHQGDGRVDTYEQWTNSGTATLIF